MARGAAYADIDNDGAPDILLTNNGGPAYLFHNVGGSRNNAIRIKTVGTRSNRDGIGAEVHVRSGAGENWQTVHSGSSYCSQSELTLTFGLGQRQKRRQLRLSGPAAYTTPSKTSRPTTLTPSKRAAKSSRRGRSSANHSASICARKTVG